MWDESYNFTHGMVMKKARGASRSVLVEYILNVANACFHCTSETRR